MSEKTGGEVTTMPYRVARYRLLLVKDGTVPTTWDRQLRQSRDVADLMAGVGAGFGRAGIFVVLLGGEKPAGGGKLLSPRSPYCPLRPPPGGLQGGVVGLAAAPLPL